MSEILIRGVVMPKSCNKCDLRVIAMGLDFQCAISGETVDDYYSSRHPKCPLVEIPTPHGRLIDADELIGYLNEWLSDSVALFGFTRIINHQPTIIEAEVSE